MQLLLFRLLKGGIIDVEWVKRVSETCR